ncbi:MAG: restriction endonuclease [Fimbriimonadaceae bacterium]|nr:restriction endonuclease [Fimbriimonadaceae bacterium]
MRIITSLWQLEEEWGYEAGTLAFVAYRTNIDSRYTTYNIRKRTQGYRQIDEPDELLKGVQRKIKEFLEDKYVPTTSAYAYVSNRSPVKNAALHTRKKWIVNIDIKDFFPSIHFGRICGVLQSKPFHLEASTAKVLATICTRNHALPQGAPSSPILSNIISYSLDIALIQFARSHGFYYTRYADDITFSTWQSKFPNQLLTVDHEGTRVADSLEQIISGNGFTVNGLKTRCLERRQRQSVTGLTVNKFVNVRRKYIRQVRGMIHAWQKYGEESAQKTFEEKHLNKHYVPSGRIPKFRWVLLGRLQYIGHVRGWQDPVYRKYFRQLSELWPDLSKRMRDRFDILAQNFLELSNMTDHRAKGYALEKFIYELCDDGTVGVSGQFRRQNNIEQIDGAISFNSNAVLIECKFYSERIGALLIDPFSMKLARSGAGTQGLLISMSGYTSEALETIKLNPGQNLMLLTDADLQVWLDRRLTTYEVIAAKLKALQVLREPALSLAESVEIEE